MPSYDVIAVEPHEQVILAVVRPSRLDGPAASELEDEASRAALAEPSLPFVLDFSNVNFAPSVALGALAVLFKGLKLSNRKAFLIGVVPQVRRALSVTRLDDFINVRNTLDDVLAEI
jgi:anti-anti-sigma factor